MAFRFNCVSELYKNLGRFDAIVEFTEVAIREFIDQSERAGDFDGYLQAISAKHDISVHTVEQSVYRARISQGYILSVYQTVELFIHQFRDEHIDFYNNTWKLDDTKENLLIKTIRKISPLSSATQRIGAHRVSIFNYYRTVRNKYSHERISEAKVDQEFKIVNQNINQIQTDYPVLMAPNEFDKIAFDDFILFTRTVKDIANVLNDLVLPTNEQLRDYYIRKDFFRELNQNQLRKTNALKGHMLSNFGIEDDQANIIVNLMTVPLA